MKTGPLLPILLLTLFITGCSSVPKVKVGKTKLAPTPLAIALGPKGYNQSLKKMELTPTVPVFIFSTRNREETLRGGIDPFGTSRLKQQAPHYAIANVSIGSNVSKEILMTETLSEVKKKKSKVTLEEVKMFPETGKEFNSWGQLEKADMRHPWFTAIRKQLNQGSSREIVILVHGYNTHLTSNTELLAEIFHYKARDGAVINFEWPSGGKLLDYFQDKNNATHSTLYFRALLSMLPRYTGAKTIRIIGHSAGSPIVVNALRELRMWDNDLTPAQLQNKYRIRQVVLAAPDIDLMEFTNAVFDRFYEMTDHTAVYGSPKDNALAFAEKFVGGRRLGRAISSLEGFERSAFERVNRLELIDVALPQKTYSNFIGHSYFHRDPWVSSDIGLSMFYLKPEERGLVRSADGLFWEFPQDYPARIKEIVIPKS